MRVTPHFQAIALSVANLNAMADWYADALGFVPTRRGEFSAIGAEFVLLAAPGLTLELISRPAESHTTVDRTPPPDHLSALGWKALVLNTDDLSALTAHLKSIEAEIVWAEAFLGPGMKSTLIRDPEGNLINIFATTSGEPT